MSNRIYKIVSREIWTQAESEGVFRGATIDLTDGFIHFSSAHQAVETAAKYFNGQAGLVLVAVDADKLGDNLKWEKSRDGELFPHLYGELELDAVVSVDDLHLGANGQHVFPSLTT